MDIFAVADVYPDMAYVVSAVVEAYDVAGLHSVCFDVFSVPGLGLGRSVESIAELTVGVVDKTRAVETGLGIFPAVLVVVADVLQCELRDLDALVVGGALRRCRRSRRRERGRRGLRRF